MTMLTKADNVVDDILMLENYLNPGLDGIRHSDPADSYSWHIIRFDSHKFEYHVLHDGSIRIVGTHNDTHEDNFTEYLESADAAVRRMSSLVNRFHSIDYCHCSRPIYTRHDLGSEPFTRGLCEGCDTVRCDVDPGDCPHG